MELPTFRLTPIPDTTAAELRARGGEVYVADSVPGYPCRQCLQDAEIGEELILVSYDPFEGTSPYRSASPIFLHANPCAAPTVDAELPLQLTRRQLSVRAFDSDEQMIDAEVIDGNDLAATMGQFFCNPLVERIHVHNAGRGCWAVAAERSTAVARC